MNLLVQIQATLESMQVLKDAATRLKSKSQNRIGSCSKQCGQVLHKLLQQAQQMKTVDCLGKYPRRLQDHFSIAVQESDLKVEARSLQEEE
jgi:hypothetical protein